MFFLFYLNTFIFHFYTQFTVDNLLHCIVKNINLLLVTANVLPGLAGKHLNLL